MPKGVGFYFLNPALMIFRLIDSSFFSTAGSCHQWVPGTRHRVQPSTHAGALAIANPGGGITCHTIAGW